jgi:hypothetical protein
VQGSDQVLVILNKSEKELNLKLDLQGKRPSLIFQAVGDKILDTNGITPADGSFNLGPNRVQIYSLN